MSTPIQEALQLLLTGMTTVALVLGAVVGAGRLLIFFINRTARQSARTAQTSTADTQMDPAVIAVLNATVEIVTEGKGHIQQIETL